MAIEDFKYDFTYYLISNPYWCYDTSLELITRFYLFTHQFAKETRFEESMLPLVFKDFLEEGEEVFFNSFTHRIYFKIKNSKDKTLQERIVFILNILSLSVVSIDDEDNLVITYKPYENTYNDGVYERIYKTDCGNL